MALPAAIWEGRHAALAERAREREGGWGQARGWERGWGCRGGEARRGERAGSLGDGSGSPLPRLLRPRPGPARQRPSGRSRAPGRPRCRAPRCRPGRPPPPGPRTGQLPAPRGSGRRRRPLSPRAGTALPRRPPPSRRSRPPTRQPPPTGGGGDGGGPQPPRSAAAPRGLPRPRPFWPPGGRAAGLRAAPSRRPPRAQGREERPGTGRTRFHFDFIRKGEGRGRRERV